MSFATRASTLREAMDDPACDPERLRRTLRRFRIVNRAVGGWGGLYRSLIRPTLATLDRPATVLDLGCGGGDVLRRVLASGRRDGFEVTGVGVDPDPRAIEVAKDGREQAGLHFRCTDAHALVDEGARFDVVISNHVLHHLDDGAFDGFVADSAALARELCVHSDLRRSRLAYGAYAVAVMPIAAGTFLRGDGLLSIRRSHTVRELAARLPPGWTAHRAAPFRVLAVRSGPFG